MQNLIFVSYLSSKISKLSQIFFCLKIYCLKNRISKKVLISFPLSSNEIKKNLRIRFFLLFKSISNSPHFLMQTFQKCFIKKHYSLSLSPSLSLSLSLSLTLSLYYRLILSLSISHTRLATIKILSLPPLSPSFSFFAF